MALITCKECNNQISDKATSCPHCGFVQRSELEEMEDKIILSREKRTEEAYSWPKGIIGAIFGLIVGSVLSIRWGGGLFPPLLGFLFFGAGGGYLGNLHTGLMIVFIPVGLVILFIASILMSL